MLVTSPRTRTRQSPLDFHRQRICASRGPRFLKVTGDLHAAPVKGGWSGRGAPDAQAPRSRAVTGAADSIARKRARCGTVRARCADATADRPEWLVPTPPGQVGTSRHRVFVGAWVKFVVFEPDRAVRACADRQRLAGPTASAAPADWRRSKARRTATEPSPMAAA